MLFDISKIPDSIKLEIRKGDLEAFAQTLLAQSRHAAAPTVAAKEILNVDEASAFTGLAKQTLYGFTSKRAIPHFKRGKSIVFRRSELEAWMLANKRRTVEELTHETTKPRKP